MKNLSNYITESLDVEKLKHLESDQSKNLGSVDLFSVVEIRFDATVDGRQGLEVMRTGFVDLGTESKDFRESRRKGLRGSR